MPQRPACLGAAAPAFFCYKFASHAASSVAIAPRRPELRAPLDGCYSAARGSPGSPIMTECIISTVHY